MAPLYPLTLKRDKMDNIHIRRQEDKLRLVCPKGASHWKAEGKSLGREKYEAPGCEGAWSLQGGERGRHREGETGRKVSSGKQSGLIRRWERAWALCYLQWPIIGKLCAGAWRDLLLVFRRSSRLKYEEGIKRETERLIRKTPGLDNKRG